MSSKFHWAGSKFCIQEIPLWNKKYQNTVMETSDFPCNPFTSKIYNVHVNANTHNVSHTFPIILARTVCCQTKQCSNLLLVSFSSHHLLLEKVLILKEEIPFWSLLGVKRLVKTKNYAMLSKHQIPKEHITSELILLHVDFCITFTDLKCNNCNCNQYVHQWNSLDTNFKYLGVQQS